MILKEGGYGEESGSVSVCGLETDCGVILRLLLRQLKRMLQPKSTKTTPRLRAKEEKD